MNKYMISSEMGRLCKTKQILTDKLGNKRKGLVYWSEISNKKVIKFNRISVLLQYILIKVLANDIKNVRIIKENKKQEDANE